MHGVLGGLRNMLRQWRVNYLRHKKKKQKEIEEGKLAKYYSLKRIMYSGFAIVCYPFYLFHTPSKEITKAYPDLVKIEKEIQNLLNAKGSISLKKIDKKIEKIESKLVKIEKQVVQKPDTSKELIVQKLKKEMAIFKVRKPITTKEVVVQKSSNISIDVPIASLEYTSTYMPIDVKEEKIKLEKIKEKVDKIVVEIVHTQDYSLFYDLERKLLECKKELENLQEGIQKEYFLGLLSLVEYNHRCQPIQEVLEEVMGLENQIRNTKKQMFTAESKTKPETSVKKKAAKETVEEKDKNNDKKSISEWEQAQKVIMEQIKEQNRQLLNLQKQKPTFKKKVWHVLSGFANYAMQLLFSVTPLMMFKNKLLGTLVTTIMVNNSLKSMKKVLRPQEILDYEWLGNEYKDKKMYLQNIYRVSKDSLLQLDIIKEDVMTILQKDSQNQEILSLLNQLNQIEKATIDVHNRAKIEGNIIDKQFTKILTKEQ